MIICSLVAISMSGFLSVDDIPLNDPNIRISDVASGTGICIARMRTKGTNLCSIWIGSISKDQVMLIKRIAKTAEFDVQDRDRVYFWNGICAVIAQSGMYSKRLVIYNINENQFAGLPNNVVMRHPVELKEGLVGNFFETKANGSMAKYIFTVSRDGVEWRRWPPNLIDFWENRNTLVVRTMNQGRFELHHRTFDEFTHDYVAARG